jgi:hypothetical protein
MVLDFGDSGLSSTIGATIESFVSLDAVTDDLATAVIADRREFVDRTLETVKGMTRSGSDNFEGQVIVVAAHFTFCHCNSPSLLTS